MTNGAAVWPAGRPAALPGRSQFLGELSDAQHQPNLFLAAFFLLFVPLFFDLFSSFSVDFAVDRKSMFFFLCPFILLWLCGPSLLQLYNKKTTRQGGLCQIIT